MNVITNKSTRLFSMAALSLFVSLAASADSPDLSWFTVAGGGATYSTGGGFSLGGTIGQPAVDVLSGGGFSLEGGFWRGIPFCDCHGDFNDDLAINGKDIRAFVKCMIASQSDCDCADINVDGTINFVDLSEFVTDLLTGQPCPN